MTREDALALLGAQCAATIAPTLSSEELTALLNATDAWDTWAALTTYSHGDQVVPTVRNGHVYRAIVNQQYSASPAGVSAATEPIWPLFSSPDSQVGITRPYWSGYDGLSGNYSISMVTDGTVVWQDAGADRVDPWDLRLATYNAWMQKAAKASATFDFDMGGGRWIKREQVIQHCLTMADRFAPTGLF